MCLSAAATVPLFGGWELAAGARHTCAVVSGGAVKCWGDNGNGQLGNGTTVGASMPVEVVGVFGATAVAAGRSRLTGTVPFGGDHTCAIVVGGRVKCWGDNTFGQLGNGTTGQVNPEAVDVIGVSGATTLASGARHTCVIVGGGAIKCWGNNSHGQLGNGTTSPASLTAVDVIGIASASALAAGSEHTCAISVGGGVKCWGANDKGQLGDGTTTDSSIAVNATGIHGATALAAGNGHSCAIGVGGAVKCWGANCYGQLGNGTTVDAQPRARITPAPSSAARSSAGDTTGTGRSATVPA